MVSIKKLFGSNKRVIKTALPIFVELMLTILIGNVDQFMISSDQSAVNAIIQANTVINILLITFSILSTASIILISECRGAKQFELQKKIYALSFYFNIALGIIVSLIIVFFSEPIFTVMKVDPSVMEDAKRYMTITGSFVVFQALISTFGAFLRADRLNSQSTVIAFIMNLVNIGLNAIFLYGFKMGITGVAIATDVSRFAGLVGVIICYVKKIHVSLSIKMIIPFPGALLKKLLKIGLPSAGENLSYFLSQSVVQVFINMLGVTEGNIRGYVLNLVMLVYLFGNGITQALQVEEGDAIGKKNYARADRLVKDTLKMSMFVSFIMSILLLCVSYPIFLLLMGSTEDPTGAAKLAVIILSIDIILEQGRTGNIVMVRSLQTAGDINFPIILSIIFCWVVAVGGTYLFAIALNLGIIGCWIANTLDECTRSFIFIMRWRKGKWRDKSLVSSLK